MTQFRDHVSEGLWFQILNMQICLFPCHENPRLMKWSNLCQSFLQPTLEAGINSVTFFQLGIPCPHREASAHPWAQFHLFFSHLSDHLPLSTGWHPADIHTSHQPPPAPRHLGIGTLSHFCPSLFQTSTARPKWQEANVEFKSEGCRQTRLATSVLQKWHSNCANLITKVQPCLCQGGEGERDQGCLGLIGLSFSTCWVNHMQFSRPLDSHN